MVLFSDRGPRSVPDEDVIFVYRDRAMGRYCSATLVLSSGEAVSGLALVSALDRLPERLDALDLPPKAA
jgi:hypothetical protein